MKENVNSAKQSSAPKPDQKVNEPATMREGPQQLTVATRNAAIQEDAPSPVVLAYAWPSFTLQKSREYSFNDLDHPLANHAGT